MAYYMIFMGLIGLAVALLWSLQPSYDADEPRPVAHWIPILGHGLHWASNRRGFFEWADRKGGRQPYSVLIAGRKHYVFSQPADVSAIFRKSKTLSIKPFVELINNKLFCMPQRDTETYTTASPSMHELHSKYLLRPEHYTPVVNSYFTSLGPLLQRVDDDMSTSPSGATEKNVLDIILDTMTLATMHAYFGSDAASANPRIGHDMATFFNEGFWPALSGAPAFYMRNAMRARDRIKLAIASTVLQAGPDEKPNDTSEYVQEMIKLLTPLMSRDGVITNEFGFVFGFTSNSVPTTYNTLLHILTAPSLLPAILTEIRASGFPTASPSEKATMVPSALPLLRSCYFETIRMHTVAASIRQVMEPTEIATKPTATNPAGQVYRLKKGGVVNLPSTLLHFNPAVNPDPEVFHPRRFLAPEQGGEGQNPLSCTRGFGGGTSYCPGRVFAERQIIGFLAAFLTRFDVAVANDGDWVMPPTNEFDDVAKSKQVRLTLRRRDATVKV